MDKDSLKMDAKKAIYERMVAEGCNVLPNPTMLWAWHVEEMLLLEQNFLLRECLKKKMEDE